MNDDEFLQDASDMPRPDAVWIALAIVVFALVVALPPKRRRLFIHSLEILAAGYESSERVLPFGPRRRANRSLQTAIKGGVVWIKRLIVELERAARP